MCSHRSPRGDRRCSKEEYFPLFVLFVLFGQAKRTLKEKNHNVTFLLSYFCMTKRRVQGGEATSERRRRDGVYQKSARRTHAVLLATTAACTSLSRELCVASACGKGQRGNRQCRTPRNLILPRVRTYHTRKSSRFVHALSARPLKVQGGRVEVPALTGRSTYFLLFLLAMLGLIS